MTKTNRGSRYQKVHGRSAWTATDDELLLEYAPRWKDLLPLMPTRTHASLACRYKRILDERNPERNKIPKRGEGKHAGWSAKRAARVRERKQQIAISEAQTNSEGIYTAVSNLVNRAVATVLSGARDRRQCKAAAKNRRQEINEKKRKRRKEDDRYRLTENMRRRLADHIRLGHASKAEKTGKLVGCSWNKLKEQLNAKLDGRNISTCDVDHVFPLSMFDLTVEEHQFKSMNYSNLQPLTDTENSSKRNRLPTKAMARRVAHWCWPNGITEDMLPDIYPDWLTPLRRH